MHVLWCAVVEATQSGQGLSNRKILGIFRTSQGHNMRGPRFGGIHLHQGVVLAGAQMDKMSLLEDALKHLDEPFQLVVVGEVNSGAPLPPKTALGCSISPYSTQLLQPPDIGIRQYAGMA